MGLAFRVVDIPQSGLLAQIISLSNAQGIQARFLLSAMQPTPRLPAQPLLANGGCRRMQASALLLRWGSYRRARNLRVLIVYLFFLPVM